MDIHKMMILANPGSSTTSSKKIWNKRKLISKHRLTLLHHVGCDLHTCFCTLFCKKKNVTSQLRKESLTNFRRERVSSSWPWSQTYLIDLFILLVFLHSFSAQGIASPLWGSFVTHSLLPLHGGEMNAWRTNPKGRLRGGYSGQYKR